MSDDSESCKELIRNCLNYARVHLDRQTERERERELERRETADGVSVICHTLNNHGVTAVVDRQ